MTREFDRFKIEWIFVRDISPHPKVQRPFDEKWAQKIGGADFDPDKFDPINVVRRGTKYLVFAGQHRHAGARIALGDDQRIPCHVHQDVPIEHLAAICLGVDHVKAWKIIDRWNLRILAKQDVPLKIEAIVHRHNLKIGKGAEEGSVRAVAALETVYMNHGGEAGLDRTLKILGGAYGRDKDAYDGTLIRGAGLLVHRFDEQLDDASLSLKLSRHSGPGRLVGSARDWSKDDGISVFRAMAVKMLKVYNTGRRTGKLEL